MRYAVMAFKKNINTDYINPTAKFWIVVAIVVVNKSRFFIVVFATEAEWIVGGIITSYLCQRTEGRIFVMSNNIS